MKTLLCLSHSQDRYEIRYSKSTLSRLCFLTKIIAFIVLSWSTTVKGQDIPLENPSLEDVPQQGKAPEGWIMAMNTPDIQPGIFGVVLQASDGRSYVGLHSGLEWNEGLAQAVTLKGGHSYTLSFDLAFTSFYAYAGCYGDMVIYAGDTPGDSAEVLWRSGHFYHTSWRKYNAVINPSRDYRYISFWAGASAPCEKSAYGSVVLLDNISPFLREIPQVIISVENTCKGTNMGAASARIVSGVGPYTYCWSPGGQTANQIEHLSAGSYQLTVTSRNGTEATVIVAVKETDLESTVTTIPSICNGDKQNQIWIHTEGGVPPYRYYLNNIGFPSYTPIFKELIPGEYFVIVKDDQGCENKLTNIKLNDPLPLQIIDVNKKDISCNEVKDGIIELSVTGGITPYSYRLEAYNWQEDKSWKQLGEGKYSFEVKDQNGCISRGTTKIYKKYRACAVYVPTAFSPNGDGQNDLFRIKLNDDISNYRLTIYNRWGAAIFLSSDPQVGWDGNQQPGGSYLWIITYTDSKQQARKQTGTLALIR